MVVTNPLPRCGRKGVFLSAVRHVEFVVDTAIGSERSGPRQEITVHDLTAKINGIISDNNIDTGVATIASLHTTTSIIVNEYEAFLAGDLRDWVLRTIDPSYPYRHNDIDERPSGKEEYDRCIENGFAIDDAVELKRWREQEPINAHSHIAAIVCGGSTSLPIVDSSLRIGQWNSVMLVDFDGPRNRTVTVTIIN